MKVKTKGEGKRERERERWEREREKKEEKFGKTRGKVFNLTRMFHVVNCNSRVDSKGIPFLPHFSRLFLSHLTHSLFSSKRRKLVLERERSGKKVKEGSERTSKGHQLSDDDLIKILEKHSLDTSSREEEISLEREGREKEKHHPTTSNYCWLDIHSLQKSLPTSLGSLYHSFSVTGGRRFSRWHSSTHPTLSFPFSHYFHLFPSTSKKRRKIKWERWLVTHLKMWSEQYFLFYLERKWNQSSEPSRPVCSFSLVTFSDQVLKLSL